MHFDTHHSNLSSSSPSRIPKRKVTPLYPCTLIRERKSNYFAQREIGRKLDRRMNSWLFDTARRNRPVAFFSRLASHDEKWHQYIPTKFNIRTDVIRMDLAAAYAIQRRDADREPMARNYSRCVASSAKTYSPQFIRILSTSSRIQRRDMP